MEEEQQIVKIARTGIADSIEKKSGKTTHCIALHTSACCKYGR